jgi:Protein of unknown function (DUF1559)
MNRCIIIVCLGWLSALPIQAQETQLPPDLAAVPPGALGFLHVRAADIWKLDALKDLRAMIQKAGPKALQAFDDRFVPAPSTIDRITVFSLMPGDQLPSAPFIGVVACNQPFDHAKLVNSLLPKGKDIKIGNVTVHADDDFDLAIRVIDNRTFALASLGTMRQYLENPPSKDNTLGPALAEAARKHHIVLAVNTSILPNEAVAELPEPLQPLTRAKMAMLSLDVGSDLALDVRLQFADEAQARTGEAAAQAGIKMARDAIKAGRRQFEEKVMPKDKNTPSSIQELPEAALSVLALGSLETLDEFLKDLPLKRDGAALSASAKVRAGPYLPVLGIAGMSAGFAMPAVAKARLAGNSSRSANNLKQIMLAFHSYHDGYNGFPGAAIIDKNGKPLLSWRVSILPFIEQNNLYKQFHLDEPWDSEHNKKLIPMMPKIYAVPNVSKPGDTDTHYRVFYGNGAALELKKSVRLSEFLDGTSNTIVVVEAADGVPWTKPDEFEYDPKKPLPKLGKVSTEGFWVAVGDGSVRFVNHKIKETTLRAAITRNGGEVFNWDD